MGKIFVAPGKSVTSKNGILDAGTEIVTKHGFSAERTTELLKRGIFTEASLPKVEAAQKADLRTSTKRAERKPADADAESGKSAGQQ